ncbi:hypothetical protein H671_3g9772 [Cricetulus griseus]|nr:hypothetical protein H671_3g9772 [Cricetulus griseus]
MTEHCRHPGNSDTSIHEKRTDIRVLDLFASTRRERWSHTHQKNKKLLLHPPEERMRRGQGYTCERVARAPRHHHTPQVQKIVLRANSGSQTYSFASFANLPPGALQQQKKSSQGEQYQNYNASDIIMTSDPQRCKPFPSVYVWNFLVS